MTAEEKLAKIAAIYNTETDEGGHIVTSHAYYNLLGALIDLKRTGKADKIIIDTLERVEMQLGEIGKVLSEQHTQ